MKCPFCSENIEGKICSFCDKENPSDAAYCTNCGNAFEDITSFYADNDNEFSDTGDEFPDIENRELCQDGTCTGIIINNKCTECGKSPNEI